MGIWDIFLIQSIGRSVRFFTRLHLLSILRVKLVELFFHPPKLRFHGVHKDITVDLTLCEENISVLDFKLSPCTEYSKFPLG